jgi:hypothetical protein
VKIARRKPFSPFLSIVVYFLHQIGILVELG